MSVSVRCTTCDTTGEVEHYDQIRKDDRNAPYNVRGKMCDSLIPSLLNLVNEYKSVELFTISVLNWVQHRRCRGMTVNTSVLTCINQVFTVE